MSYLGRIKRNRVYRNFAVLRRKKLAGIWRLPKQLLQYYKEGETAREQGVNALSWKGLFMYISEYRDCGKGKEEDAYFTVEAAVIVPVVLFLFVMIIYLSFYLYDRCVMTQDFYILSYRQSLEKGKADRSSTGEIHKQTGNKLFMLSGFEASASSGGTIRVNGNARINAPLPGAGSFFPLEGDLTLSAEGKARRTDPPAAYRKVRRIMNLSKEVLSHKK